MWQHQFSQAEEATSKCQHLGIGLLSFDLSFFFSFVIVPTLVNPHLGGE